MKKILAVTIVLLSLRSSAASAQPAPAEDGNDRYQLPTQKIDLQRAADARHGDRIIAIQQKDRFEEQIEMVKKRRDVVTQWAGLQFQAAERHIIDKPKAMSALMERWQRQRDLELYAIVQHGEMRGGSIESGEDLNRLLQSVGATALQNEEVRRIKPDAALPLTAPETTIAVDRALADEIDLADNVLGAKGVMQGGRGPLDGLDWPTILREERWKPYRERFDEARERAKAEIKSSGFVSEKTDADLRSAVNELNSDFTEYKRQWCNDNPGQGNMSEEWRRVCNGRDHILKLVTAAYHAAQMTPAQVAYHETYDGGNVEDFITYCRRNNLKFAKAREGHASAYHKLFNMMVRYYLDVHMAVNLERELDREIATLKVNRQQAVNAALGQTTLPSHEAAIRIMSLEVFPNLNK